MYNLCLKPSTILKIENPYKEEQKTICVKELTMPNANVYCEKPLITFRRTTRPDSSTSKQSFSVFFAISTHQLSFVKGQKLTRNFDIEVVN